MQWWRNAGFGMFIHWGLNSVAAVQYSKEKNYAEWIQETGMKYIVITSKHHDGFCLWKSEVCDYNMESTTSAVENGKRKVISRIS